MHHGEYIGAKAAKKRILILGESHRISKDTISDDRTCGVAATYTTAGVVEEYLRTNNTLTFFKKIGEAFGQPMKSQEDKIAFWEQFYFGNYIDVLCGVRTDAAKAYLCTADHRQAMNDALFDFINHHKIDVVVCFSRLVYNHLPSLNRRHKAKEDLGKVVCPALVGGKTDYIAQCRFLPSIPHAHTAVTLEKPLSVYCLRHPSARGGFCAENYVATLSVLLD